MRTEVFDAVVLSAKDNKVKIRLESWDDDQVQVVIYDLEQASSYLGFLATVPGTTFHCHAALVKGVIRIRFGLPDGSLVVNEAVILRPLPTINRPAEGGVPDFGDT